MTRVLLQYAELILMIVVLQSAVAEKFDASQEEEAKTVAALDTKYQAAVKANDAATMDQILADDFALVTGRGKVYGKADLIDSARKKEVTYERRLDQLEALGIDRASARHRRILVEIRAPATPIAPRRSGVVLGSSGF